MLVSSQGNVIESCLCCMTEKASLENEMSFCVKDIAFL